MINAYGNGRSQPNSLYKEGTVEGDNKQSKRETPECDMALPNLGGDRRLYGERDEGAATPL